MRSCSIAGVVLLCIAAVLPAPCMADEDVPERPPRWHVPGTERPGLPWGGCAPTSGRQEFFPLDDLPPLSLGRTLPDDVVLLNEHRLSPDLTCYCD